MGKDTMVNDEIESARLHAKGFTLIATLLMLLLLSGVAIGLMMMVHTENKVGATDLQNDVAFHSAEGGIEKQASDLAAVFQNAQSPTCDQIISVGAGSNRPALPGISWDEYSVTPATTTPCTGSTKPKANWGQISSGQNSGLWAQIIPVNMLATASLVGGGQEVSMMRSAQVALIPVFQFGVFCEGDCGFFNSPDLTFVGRVHTNSDLYLGVSSGSTLIFNNKLEAYGNVVTEVLPNGLDAKTYNDTGNVYIPITPGGCSTTTTNCVLKNTNGDGTYGQGSVTGAGSSTPQTGSTYNASNWNPFSKTKTNLMLINGNYGANGTYAGTGAKKLSMPFVSGTTSPFELIRRPPTGESLTSALGESRDYNLAQIRVLLSDDPAELPGGASDSNNVRLANVGGAAPSNQYGIPITNPVTPAGLTALGSGSTYNMYFAAASNATPDETPCAGTNCPTANIISSLASDWSYSPRAPQAGAQTLVPLGAPIVSGANGTGPLAIPLCPPTNVASLPAGCPAVTALPYYATVPATAKWNLIDGYLRVEYKNVSGNWNPVTNEWLGLGFSRGLTPPIAGVPNPINPNAILLLQEPADRNGNGAIDTGIAPSCTKTVSGVCTQWKNPLPPEVFTDTASNSPWFGVTTGATTSQSVSLTNWYPINFYDAREGEPRDISQSDNSCTPNGVMNAVEIDVGNLKKWLAGTIGSSGTSVDYVAQNGYVLYFSDRRGMLPSPNAVSSHTVNTKTGDSGLEDVVNRGSAAGTPDAVLEPAPAGRTQSPEDVNQNGLLDEWGTANLGLGQYNGTVNLNTSITTAAPDNPYVRITSCSVTARKNWVSGARHVLKLVDGALGNVPLSPTGGGFTVASENPVYIQGDYNSKAGDTFFTGATASGPGPDSTSPVHAPAAVIADAVTILSNAWVDKNSMLSIPTKATSGIRNASTTYYRVAIAGGKNLSFQFPTWENSTNYGNGTDGGVHNFLRFLEDWTGQTLNYGGSLVSLYYATYNTGLFKCCTYAVYKPPTRNYYFDVDFTNPSGLPPGTPMFKDVESLGYRQLFTTRIN
ncbi:MAG: hypothetical protein LAO30_16965 [Acidobacteriia bacterium]|nr:hypothetical protein [Terriglobia bacterium]